MGVSPPAVSRQYRATIDRLREAGYDIRTFDELRNCGVRYQKAIPILVAALPEITEHSELDGLVRALSVPWAKPAATGPLIELFRRVEHDSGLGVRWTIGNALDVTWNDDFFDELVELARDRRYGRAREMIVLGMARSKRAEVGEILIELLDDPDVNGHAVNALRKLKPPPAAARPGLTRMLQDERAWVRGQARHALEKLN